MANLFRFDESGHPGHEQALTDRLIAYNQRSSPLWEQNHDGRHATESLQSFVYDAGDDLVGGVIGRTHGIRDWLEIAILWVDEPCRGQGLGRRLIDLAESEALRRRCRFARVSTPSHQAPGFYEAMGYRLYGRLEECPPGETALYFHKDLSAS